jgi:hypothetical protein
MPLFRARDPQAVRRDALAVAERKAAQGCDGCAESYLQLAEENGAPRAEVDQIRRRLFTRAGALAGLGLAGQPEAVDVVQATTARCRHLTRILGVGSCANFYSEADMRNLRRA